jgi:hypothetical protein
MTKDAIVEKGWYRLTLTGRQRFTGKCNHVSTKTHGGKSWKQYSFDVGERENEKFVQPHLLILHQDDIASAIRLSPRYIEYVRTREGGWDVLKYKGLLKYGEE